MNKNYYRFPGSTRRRASVHGIDGMFAWTIFIFLLMGFALFCWIGSFYIFGHPEKAGNYHLLMRLHKLEEPQRFELTEAPRGEFLKSKQILERFRSLSSRERRKLNDGLLANFIRNYHQTHDLTPYVTGTYRVLAAFPLTNKNFFYPGVCALLQSTDQPEILLEQVFPATNGKLISKLDHAGEVKRILEAQNSSIQEILKNSNTSREQPLDPTIVLQKNSQDIAPLEQVLIPGQEIKFEKPLDLSAVLHVEKLPDDRLKLTTISLLYGSYGPTNSGPLLFSLAPPVHLNVEAGLPILSAKDLILAEEQYAAYRAKMGSSNQEGSQPVQSNSTFVLQIISNKSTPVKTALQKSSSRLEKETIATSSNPATSLVSTQKVARALPLNTPAILPATPVALPATPVDTPPSAAAPAKLVAKALPTAPPLPPATRPSPTPVLSGEAAAEAGFAVANQSILPSPNSFTTATEASTNVNSMLYNPGKIPRGRFVTPSQFSDLAEQGLAGQRLYLQGDFAVTASGQDRSVLRYQPSTTSTLTPDRIAKIRIIVSYPAGVIPPAEGTSLARNQDSPFMITDVKKGNDGTVNVYAKEIIK